jgi:5'-nucleotidase
MRILLTNDDGVHAEGLLALKTALGRVADVVVVAPDRPRSACGHSVTLHEPLRVMETKLADGSPAFATTGTPTDCVMLALRGVLDRQPDLVFSGINDGPNLGWDLTYSGTVAGAMEAAISGVTSVAVSCVRINGLNNQEDYGFVRPDRPAINYGPAGEFCAHLATVLFENRLPDYVFLNVNVPSLPREAIRGVQLTRQGVRRYPGQAERRLDPMGREYYWLGGDIPQDVLVEGTDVHAIAERAISVTPIHMDQTAYPVMESLHQWSRIEEWGRGSDDR